MAKVTGHRILASIKNWEIKKASIVKRYEGSLYAFADEVKDPRGLMEEFKKCERAIAKLQALQSAYNLAVKVNTKLGDMTLCEAIKTVGGAGRVEGMLRTASLEEDDRRSIYGRVRNKVENLQQEMAKRVIPVEESVQAALEASAITGSLKSAIAEGNSTSITMEVEDSLLV